MAGWVDPRPNDFSVEGLRARFKSLQDWLREPEFTDGVRLGDGTPPTYDDATGVTVPPALTPIDSGTFDALDQDLVDLRTDLDTLNDTTLPGLDFRLGEAEADVAQALLEGVTVVSSLPPLPDANYPSGKVVYLQATGQNKLYRNVSGTWSAATPASDLTGQITETQITDNAVTTPKIAAGAVTATEIATNAVTADKILAGAVTAGKIAADAVTASEIAAGTITSAEIAAGTITANEIASGTITANEIAAGTITSNELAADAVTANELAALNIAVGKYIRSTTYTPGVDGWAIDADGSAEFNDVTVRGSVEASEFHGAPTASILGVNGTFDTNTTGWSAYTADFPSSAIARVTDPVRSGSGALRIDSSSGAGVRGAYTEVTVAPGDIVHAAGWVLKDDVSDNAAETWWDTVTVNVDFYDNTNTLVHQYFNESIQSAGWYDGSGYSPTPEWRLLEVYAAAPLDLGITKARIYFSSYSNAAAVGKYALYVDDVTIGIAPLLEVPYMVTHEDGERKRAIVTPQQFAFESQFSNYPYGLRARHNAHTPSLRVTGPYGFGNQAPQLELEHDLLNAVRTARFGVDVVGVPDGTLSRPGVAFAADTDTGIYRSSANVLSFSSGGVHQFSTGYASRPGLHLHGGTDLSRPPLAFSNDLDTGLLRSTSSGQDALFLIAGGDWYLRGRTDGAMQYPRHPTIASAANVHMSTSGWIYRSTSSGDIKRDVETLNESVIDSLRPVTFKAKPEHVAEDDDPEKEFVGFIAEEVAEADPRLAQRDEDGEVVYFDVNGLMAHLVAEVQSLRERVAALEASVDAQPGRKDHR